MEKFKKNMQKICEIMELLMAVLVLAAILLSIFSILRNFDLFRDLANDVSAFRGYLESIFTIVIGIEFLAMLCRPNSDNVIEVLIFLVARHMIVGDTSSYEDFVSVISIALLCVLRRYLAKTREKEAKEAQMEDDPDHDH